MGYEQTTRWGFATRQTDVATNTTLGTATRYEFGAKTITVNASNVTIRSAFLKIKITDSETTTAVDWDGIRVGSNVAGSGWVDVDTTLTAANSGENECMEWLADITSDVVASVSGTVTTFTLDVALAVATGVASNVRGHTVELVLTYTSDLASTQMKTVVYVLQASDTLTTGAYSEAGAVTTTANFGVAPENQIPQLTGAGDPELCDIGSGSIKDQYIYMTGTYDHSGTADFTVSVRLDGATDIALSTHESGLASDTAFSEIIPAANMPSTSATHAFEMKSSTSSTSRYVGGLLVVTYEYDTTASNQLNSCYVPLAYDWRHTDGSTDTTPVRAIGRLHIQEPGPIIPRQSGMLWHHNLLSANQSYQIGYAGQTPRKYLQGTGYVYTGTCELTHRFDCAQSPFALARGWNELGVDVVYSSVETVADNGSGYAIINYHSGKSAHGVSAHNHTTWWYQLGYRGSGSATGETYTPTPPIITGNYKLSAVVSEIRARSLATTFQQCMKLNVDDDAGPGVTRTVIAEHVYSESGTKQHATDIGPWFRGESVGSYSGGVWSGGAVELQSYGADIEVSHNWSFATSTTNLMSYGALMGVTYHQIYANVNGAYTVDGVAETNFTWDLYGIDELENTSVLVASGQIGGSDDGNGINAAVYDDTLLYQIVVHDATNNWSVASAMGYAAMYSGTNSDRYDTPSIRSKGTAINVGATSGTPTLGKHRKYDYSVLAVFTNGDEDITLSDAQGFAEIASSPQDQGSGGTSAKLKVFTKQHSGKNDTSPTLSASSTWMIAQILTIRNCHRSAPLDDTDGSTAATSTSVSMPDTTPTVDNDLILQFLSENFDNASLQTPSGGKGWVNSNLKDLREVLGLATATSDGGSGYCAAGKKLTSGAIGNTTTTLANTATQAMISIALKPHVPSAGTFNIAAFSGGGGAVHPRFSQPGVMRAGGA